MAVSSIRDNGGEDPLSRLQERIRRAKTPEKPARFDVGVEDPLARLGELIERAHDLDADDYDDVPEPLATLQARIDQARGLDDIDALEPAGDDPIDTIRRWREREAEEIGRRDEPRLRSSPTPGPIDAATSDASVEAIIGREVLAMMAREPLPAEARARAARLLAEALDEPTPASIRRALRVILGG